MSFVDESFFNTKLIIVLSSLQQLRTQHRGTAPAGGPPLKEADAGCHDRTSLPHDQAIAIFPLPPPPSPSFPVVLKISQPEQILPHKSGTRLFSRPLPPTFSTNPRLPFLVLLGVHYRLAVFLEAVTEPLLRRKGLLDAAGEAAVFARGEGF